MCSFPAWVQVAAVASNFVLVFGAYFYGKARAR